MKTKTGWAAQDFLFFIFYSARLNYLIIVHISFACLLAVELIKALGWSLLGVGLFTACALLVGTDFVEYSRLLRLTIWRTQPRLLLENTRVFDLRLAQIFCLAGRFLWLIVLALWFFSMVRSTREVPLIHYILLALLLSSNGALAWCDVFLCFRRARVGLILYAANRR